MFELNQVPSQKGRVAIVTGANIGLGYETAKALAAKEVTVVLACRSEEKALAAQKRIWQEYPSADLHFLRLELSQLSSVRRFAQEFSANFSRLDLLINNAGVMVPPFQKTEDGFELQMGVNYFSHFLLTSLLIDTLEQNAGARVVNLGSVAHRRGRINFNNLNSEKHYSRIMAYSRSKLAMLMFSYELARRLSANHYQTISVAAHPGMAYSNIAQHLPRMIDPFIPLVTQNVQQGALPQLYAALGEDIKNGDYTGPNGFMEFKGLPVKVGSRRHSKDETVARQLWERSCELTSAQWF